MSPTITATQRRARLGRRHHLAVRASGAAPEVLVEDLLVLHATDPASVYLSLAARSLDLTDAAIGRALYDDRTLIRMLGMRRTMFVVPTGVAAVVQHSSSVAVASRLRRALVKELGAVVPGDADAWLADVEASVVDRLRATGGATAVALAAAEPRLRTQLVMAAGKTYGGAVAITSRALTILAAQGAIVRGRPGGGWTASRYEWAPIEKWLPAGFPALNPNQARAALVDRYLAAFGPATVADLVWWTGWNQGDTRRAVSEIDTVTVDLGGESGLVLADDTAPVDEPAPWIALLPALDPTPMGWFGRDWYLEPAYRAALFDRTGNIGPSIWCDGRVVGGWAHGAGGTVRWRLFTDIGAEQAAAVAAEAARLTDWMAGVRVLPKFRTPLEKELAAG